ncbi:hypothetical protein Plhal304r1_c027g0089501 [Plasmopara halstedii]
MVNHRFLMECRQQSKVSLPCRSKCRHHALVLRECRSSDERGHGDLYIIVQFFIHI